MHLKFKMHTVEQVVSQNRSEDWFVMIDLKNAYFHVSISSIRADGGSTSRYRSRSYERVGVKSKRQEKCAFSLQKTTYLDVVWHSITMQAHLSPARIELIQKKACHSVKQFKKLLGLMAAVSNVIPFGLLYMVAQDQGVIPKGKPASHDQGHAAMPTCLGHLEETLVLVSGPGVGSSLSPRNASDGRIPDRFGSSHEWPPCPRSVEWSPSRMAHQLPGDAGHVSSTQTLSSGPKRSPCVVRTDNTTY